MKRCSFGLNLILSGLLVFPVGSNAESAEQAGAAANDGSGLYWFHALEEYRARIQSAELAGDESDQDLRLFLESGIRGSSDAWGAETALGLWWDLDNKLSAGRTDGLGSIYDHRQPWWDVFTLQADYTPGGTLKLARAGRQASEHGIPVTFDGASILVGIPDPALDFFAFGGRSVHFFETEAEAFEDWIGSVGAVLRPSRDLRLEADYRFYLEDSERSSDDILDHSYGLTAHLRQGDWLLARAFVRGLNASPSHTGADLRFQLASIGMGLDLNLSAQLVTLTEINERQDPYFALLGASSPHLRWRLDVWKMFDTQAGDYSLHAGFNGRKVVGADEGPFNRSLGRFYLMAQATDILTPGLFAGVVAETHFTQFDFEASWMLTAGGSIGYQCKKFRAEAGSFYQRYRYDYYRDVRELDDVRSVFASLAVKPMRWLGLKLRYEYEISDRDVHTVWLALNQSY